MPELPEVETIVRQLTPRLTGRRVLRMEVLDPLLGTLETELVEGRVIGGLRRVGKQVGLALVAPRRADPLRRLSADRLEREASWLLIHLRMTGRLTWEKDVDGPPAPPARARLRLDRGALLFRDVRRFGTLRVCRDWAEARPAGLDPLAPGLGARRLGQLLGGCPTPIKPWLMRQDRLVGLGNIYASEALFAARIHPARPAGSLTETEVTRLHRRLRAVLRRAIEMGGTSFSTFENALGRPGAYQERLGVYGRAGQPCPRCKTPIVRFVQQQRSTFFCPRCQSERDRHSQRH